MSEKNFEGEFFIKRTFKNSPSTQIKNFKN